MVNCKEKAMSRTTRDLSALFLKRLVPAGLGIALSPMFFGCFDAKIVSTDDAGSAGGSGSNVPALLIDDFEDGNRVPSDLQFGPWRCNSYNNPQQYSAQCGMVSPGNFSTYAYGVDFELVDVQNGILDYPGVTLGSQTLAPLDLSPYENIVFGARHVPRDKALPEPVSVRINLACSTVSGQAVPYSSVLSIGSAVQPSGFWQTYSLALSSFIQFDWNSKVAAIDKQACAKLVDGISFEYQPDLADGQATAATLTIDNVYLQ